MNGLLHRFRQYAWRVCCVVICAVTSIVAYRVMVVHALVEWIEQHGSAINDDCVPGLGPTAVTIGLHAPGESPAMTREESCILLTQLPVFWRLAVLNMNDAEAPPESIVDFIRKSQLKELRANGTAFDDSCLHAVVEQQTVELLSVRDTHVTFDGLASLDRLTSLNWLYIGDNGLSALEVRELRVQLDGVTIEE